VGSQSTAGRTRGVSCHCLVRLFQWLGFCFPLSPPLPQSCCGKKKRAGHGAGAGTTPLVPASGGDWKSKWRNILATLRTTMSRGVGGGGGGSDQEDALELLVRMYAHEVR
jgi:hypothetical protein